MTLGPLSIVGDEFFKEGFGPLLPGCERVPFGDLDAAGGRAARRGRRRLHRRADPGPMVTMPPAGYLRGRAGAVPALRHAVRRRRDPDRTRPHRQVVRARALGARAGLRARRQGAQRRLHAGRGDGHDAATSTSGPSGTLERSYVHQSTYGRNRLSMAAGLATLRVIERDRLVERAAQMGTLLTDGLARAAAAPRDDQGGSRRRADDRHRAPARRARARLNWRR